MRRAFSDRHAMNMNITKGQKAVHQLLFQLVHSLNFDVKIRIRHLRCQRKTRNPRNIICAGAHAFLLTAAIDDGHDLNFFINI